MNKMGIVRTSSIFKNYNINKTATEENHNSKCEKTESSIELKTAIIKGFTEAEKILGGKLPEISKETYSLVMEKLEDWKSE